MEIRLNIDVPEHVITVPKQSEIEVFRSRDYAAIRKLCVHPHIFPSISDDYTADAAKWEVPTSELVVYLLARDRDGLFGFGIFIPQTNVQYSSHMGFLPRSYGADARKAFAKMLAWMWANTNALRLVGEIVKSNRLAVRFARQAGFKPYGINRKSSLRGGVLRDQVCLGTSKPE